ncbi:MAG: hypothetical protein KAV00_02065 [Phycisphaerae bacterium]|nr:hypothetical protein [Phycisphaerae bacterium]
MSVISVKELKDDRSSEVGWKGRRHQRHFIVQCDNFTDSTPIAVSAAGIPAVGDAYTSVDEFAWVMRKHARTEQGQGHLFRVIVEYATYTDSRFTSSDSPLEKKPQISFTNVVATEPMQRDCDGKLVANSAGVPFDPPITRDQTRYNITFRRNEAVFIPIVTAQFFKDAVNADPFLGAGPGKVKVKIDSDYRAEGSYRYWETAYLFEFKLDEDGWEPLVMDAGFQEKAHIQIAHYEPGGGGPPSIEELDILQELAGPIYEAERQTMPPFDPTGYHVVKGQATLSSPQLLDGAGGRLGPGGEPVELAFCRYRKVSFRRLRDIGNLISQAMFGQL